MTTRREQSAQATVAMFELRRQVLDIIEDHWPEASTDQSDSPELRCRCGWEADDPRTPDWIDHIARALDKGDIWPSEQR